MLKHVVMFKFKPEIPEESRSDFLAELRALPGKVHDLRAMEVGENVVPSPRAYDAVLIAEFDDREALGRYAVHPEHQPVIQAAREICQNIAAVDYVK